MLTNGVLFGGEMLIRGEQTSDEAALSMQGSSPSTQCGIQTSDRVALNMWVCSYSTNHDPRREEMSTANYLLNAITRSKAVGLAHIGGDVNCGLSTNEMCSRGEMSTAVYMHPMELLKPRVTCCLCLGCELRGHQSWAFQRGDVKCGMYVSDYSKLPGRDRLCVSTNDCTYCQSDGVYIGDVNCEGMSTAASTHPTSRSKHAGLTPSPNHISPTGEMSTAVSIYPKGHSKIMIPAPGTQSHRHNLCSITPVPVHQSYLSNRRDVNRGEHVSGQATLFINPAYPYQSYPLYWRDVNCGIQCGKCVTYIITLNPHLLYLSTNDTYSTGEMSTACTRELQQAGIRISCSKAAGLHLSTNHTSSTDEMCQLRRDVNCGNHTPVNISLGISLYLSTNNICWDGLSFRGQRYIALVYWWDANRGNHVPDKRSNHPSDSTVLML
ncbi:hypothetical protein BO94DRAFT_543655 [Aspergillus sclerotioniger CBS 115572]|uniref:Uncharacterized protein n=1 Tax=Aspergillus sclerotioniger CBS 115572 TaxID=1450535 RepID=A0A317X4E3_9EURO|nr:hypothetical protein BO94DRAFT_543655 [Aspergillus sclerotioniger CBS 115572]PWY93436.1 hypothetical protein BO94DRAFT_543655 [Aspergillus sclerotioniger CBS 115572]